ncbi:DUF4139 domain-containing protein [Streptacidiphilus fuscans]|uniref:DUF4139 domain-containing protein n=1 Tax=Streptacidiphilus fuscans TaxID=2789292 RepID=A0A931FEH5_9ACTN|nr:DUF4139 domain-containing protein [Streptacidiphilus fuscans]MBF9067519.1 DUF4139 domain-containing protein [Streptacidiphilus fuscans]
MEHELLVAQSRLDSVTVHTDGALCRRRVCVQLPAGVSRVRLAGLPLVSDPHSLRARVVDSRETTPARVLDVRREERAEVVPREQLASLQRELDAAQEAYDVARARRDRIAARSETTFALRPVPPLPRRGDPPRPAPVEAVIALAGFADARLDGLNAQLLAAEGVFERAEHGLDVARHRLAEASHALPTESTRTTADAVVTIDLGSGGSGVAARSEAADGSEGEPERELELELEYAVPGATWFPSYRLQLARRTSTEAGSAHDSLSLRASIAQRTGEDWTGVRLSLSTAALLTRSVMPQLRSIRLGRRQAEQPAPPWREAPAGLSGLFGGYDAAAADAPAPTGHEPVPVAARGLGKAVAGAGAGVGAVGGNDGERELRPAMRRAAPRAAVFGAAPAAPGAAPGGPPAYGSARAQPMAAAFAAPPPAGSAAPGRALPASEPTLDVALRDLAGLELAGPGAPIGARGTLAPSTPGTPSAAVEREYRQRAHSVRGLAVPPHAVPVAESAAFDHRFDTAARVDVPADGAWHSVAVAEFPVGLTLRHLCVPSLDPQVYATVELANTSPHALLPGPLDVVVDGEYSTTVAMPALAPGARKRIGIGVEEGVRVARHSRSAESSSGLLGGTTVITQRVEVEVANRLDRPITLDVLERVPVSDEKDARIEDTAATPPWTVVPPEEDEHHRRGLRRWQLDLAPAATATLTGGYEIRIPSAKAVVGGNRRDA